MTLDDEMVRQKWLLKGEAALPTNQPLLHESMIETSIMLRSSGVS